MTGVGLTAFGFVNATGFGGSGASRTWADAGCDGLRNLQWQAASTRPFDRFGRLDLLSKAAVLAVEMMDLPTGAAPTPRSDIGIALGTQFGSLAVDVDFYGSVLSGTASPTLFTYTLPSMAIAEIAMRQRLSGANLCLMAGPDSGPLALWESMQLILSGELAGCICVAGDVANSAATQATRLLPHDQPAPCSAFAFLLESVEQSARAALADIGPSPAEAGAGNSDADTLASLCQWLASGGGPDASPLSFMVPASVAGGGGIVLHRCSASPSTTAFRR